MIYRKRFIPVYTGNTVEKKTGEIWHPVYPCVYREHCPNSTNPPNSPGLSLCIQGTRISTTFRSSRGTVYPCVYREHVILRYFAQNQNRFIPVYTGNTNATNRSRRFYAVYPCVYREHTLFSSPPIN